MTNRSAYLLYVHTRALRLRSSVLLSICVLLLFLLALAAVSTRATAQTKHFDRAPACLTECGNPGPRLKVLAKLLPATGSGKRLCPYHTRHGDSREPRLTGSHPQSDQFAALSCSDWIAATFAR